MKEERTKIAEELKSSMICFGRAFVLLYCGIRDLIVLIVKSVLIGIRKKPGATLVVFCIILFACNMYHLGMRRMEDSRNCSSVYQRDLTIDSLTRDINVYKAISKKPKLVHDTVQVLEHRTIGKDSLVHINYEYRIFHKRQ